MKKFSYDSMGTKWEISICLLDGHHLADNNLLTEIEKEIFAMSDAFDKTYSRFIKSSLVWKIAEKAGRYEVPEDFINMLKLYMELYELSEKKLNPLIGFTISDLGYDDSYTLKSKDTIRPTPDLLETVKILQDGGLTGIFTTHHTIETNQPVLFDFGAIGKGYFVDKITQYLKEKGLRRFLVNGSGDIYYSGTEPIKAGLEHPDDPTLVIGTTEISNEAMCASGINRRTWGDHHHVIDPQVSTSASNKMKATWVVAKTAALADALASCLFFVSPEALSQYKFEYVIMNNENKIKKSEGWKGEIF